MKIAFSPCPNDTFIFDAWIHGKIASLIKPEPILADIQQLNAMAYQALYPVIKVSCFTLGKITQNYFMLPSGAAVSNAGPKIISKTPFNPSELGSKTILVPGLDTTAYLLLRTLCPEPLVIGVCRYDEILDKLANDEADCGLIIHETRFNFEQAGFTEICDLGKLFTQHFGYPVPLGVVVAQKEAYKEAARSLKDSIKYAFDHPESSLKYVRSLSQEKDDAIIQEHIKTYVNEETLQISENGMKAIQTLFQLGVDQNLLPKEALKFYEIDHVCHL